MRYNIGNIKYFYAAIAVVALLQSCSSEPTENQQDQNKSSNSHELIDLTQAQYDNAQVKIGAVELRSLSAGLAVTGVIDAPPQNLISISAPLGGYIVSTQLLDGMKVKKGQNLVTLEHQDYIKLQQDFLDKKSQLDYLEKEYERQQKLRSENVNSDKTFQRTSSEYKSMKAQVNGTKEMLAYVGINTDKLSEDKISRRITLFSPVNGYISKVNINVGKYCSPTDVLFEIIDTEHLHAELTVFEKDVQKLKEGQKVKIKLQGGGSEEVEAEIHLIGRTISAERTVKVHAHFMKESTHLSPGMYINATIEISQHDAQSVPDEAVLRSEGKVYVVVLNGSDSKDGTKVYHFALKEVLAGASEFGFTEVTAVTGDLSESKIVIHGAYSILAKLKNSETE